MFESTPNLCYGAGDARKFIEITMGQPEAVHAAFRKYYPASYLGERGQRNKKEVQVALFNKMVAEQLTPTGQREVVKGGVVYLVPLVTSKEGVGWNPIAVMGVGSIDEWTSLSTTDKAKKVLSTINNFAQCGIYNESVGAPTGGLGSQSPAAPSPPPLPPTAVPGAASTAMDVDEQPPFCLQFNALPALSPALTVPELQKVTTPMGLMCMVSRWCTFYSYIHVHVRGFCAHSDPSHPPPRTFPSSHTNRSSLC